MPVRVPVLAAAVLTLAVAVLPAQEAAPDSSPPARSVIGAPATVPWLAGPLPVVSVWLEGHGPFRFGIETGARFSIMRPELADSLHLATSRLVEGQREVRLDSVRIGAALFAGVPFATGRVSQPGIDGILGLPVFSALLLTLDYPARTVTFSADTLPEPDGAEVLSLRRVGPFWGLPISLGGRGLTAILDTRSTGGLGFVSDEGLRFAGSVDTIGTASGAAIAATTVRGGILADDLRIGRFTVARPFVTIRALPPGFPTEPIIGTRLLANFIVSLDQRNGRVRLHREDASPILLAGPASRAPAGPATGQPAGDLARYTGRFAGGRTVSLNNGELFIQRLEGRALRMQRVDGDEFSLVEVPSARLRFLRDAAGTINALRVLTPSGEWETAAREP